MQTNTSTESPQLARIQDQLHAVSISEQDFRSLPGVGPSPGNIKLSFQFVLDNANPGLFTLIAWPYQGNRYTTAKTLTLEIGKWPYQLNTSQKNIFGGQKLSSKSIRKIYNTLDPNPNNEMIVFKPERNAAGNIYYTIHILPKPISEKSKDSLFMMMPPPPDPDFQTNPSPPASDDPNTAS